MTPLTETSRPPGQHLVADIDDGLRKYVDFGPGCPSHLAAAIQHSLLAPGKRLRPLLVLLTARACECPVEQALPAACAVEMIHAYSLIHDDLPAMDDDEIRRGLPTCHVAYGEATAILAADALQPVAFQVLAESQTISDQKRVLLVQRISAACGSLGMTGGQCIDLASEGHRLSEDDLKNMFDMKTGALIHASVMSACDLCDDLSPEQHSAMDNFGRAVGLAFQIRDDILDIEGETDVIGKNAGSDERLKKATWPALFGLEASRQRCDELLGAAIRSLGTFGPRSARRGPRVSRTLPSPDHLPSQVHQSLPPHAGKRRHPDWHTFSVHRCGAVKPGHAADGASDASRESPANSRSPGWYR